VPRVFDPYLFHAQCMDHKSFHKLSKTRSPKLRDFWSYKGDG
jgi:hypothetical protein